MNYKIGIYTTDYLLLLELTSRLESVYPSASLLVYGDSGLEESVGMSNLDDYVITDFGRVNEADILITLSNPAPLSEVVEKFEGTVIDAFGWEFSKNVEVFQADEPIMSVFRNLDAPFSDISAVAQLPVCVFGKGGVEDLMRQTKEIFAFEDSDNIVFENRIAFNVHFNPTNHEGLPVARSFETFQGEGGDVNLRILPVSTVFILDVYGKTPFALKNDDLYRQTDGFFTISEVAECGEIFMIKRKNGYTFAGDYIRVLIEAVIRKLNEVIG